jgi:hypothetical protein
VWLAVTDPFTIVFTTAGESLRIRYEPREDGPGMWRWIEIHHGCGEWRTQGVEPVRDVVVERECELEA